jgi:methyl-accepting chemotaxis protein
VRDIVSSAPRVNALLDGIAVGTREQARGVTEIGPAVGEVDAVTQQNAAWVQETVVAVRQTHLRLRDFKPTTSASTSSTADAGTPIVCSTRMPA